MKKASFMKVSCILLLLAAFSMQAAAEQAGVAGGAVLQDQDEQQVPLLAVLPVRFKEGFSPEVKCAPVLVASGAIDVRTIFTNERERGSELPCLTLSLVKEIGDADRFTAVGPGEVNAALEKLRLADAGYADSARLEPVGEHLEAAFLVLPEVEHVFIGVHTLKPREGGDPKVRYWGTVIANMRIVSVATSEEVLVLSEQGEAELMPEGKNPFADSVVNTVVNDVYKDLAHRLMYRALESVYPVRMIDGDDKVVVLNRGRGLLRTGTVLDVFKTAAKRTDPETGEAIGHTEEWTGRIMVRRVLPEKSEAIILSGAEELALLEGDHVCREAPESISRRMGKSAPQPVVPQGL